MIIFEAIAAGLRTPGSGRKPGSEPAGPGAFIDRCG
jgi:hypothetical protein